jgi:hypothetical protein
MKKLFYLYFNKFAKKQHFLVLIVVNVYFIFIFIAYLSAETKNSAKQNISVTNRILIKSKCSCREAIAVTEIEPSLYSWREQKNQQEYFIYLSQNDQENSSKISKLRKKYGSRLHIKPRMACDLYAELRNGPGQRILSYSLYGQNYGYYNLFDLIILQASKLLSDWNLRIYYDNTVNESIICQLECKYGSIDFCNVNKIISRDPQEYNENALISYAKAALEKASMIRSQPSNDPVNMLFKATLSQNKGESVKSAKSLVELLSYSKDFSYVHGMMWRWFPIGDDFVDYFCSRDTDSTIIEREIDSIHVWLNDSKLFHIMRDNPYHNTYILGGLWGYSNRLNRKIGHALFQLVTSTSLQLIYNKKDLNRKNQDQNFLSSFVWPLVQNTNATVHDSYNCNFLGGEPFPTRRQIQFFLT